MTAAAFSEREVRFLLDLSRRFATAPPAGSLKQRHLLAGLCRLVGATTGAAALLDANFSVVGEIALVSRKVGPDNQTIWSDESDPSDLIQEPASHHENPLLQAAVQDALRHYMECTPEALTTRGFDRAWNRSRFFRRLISPLGLDDCILSVVPLPRMKPYMAVVCFTGPSTRSRDDEQPETDRRFTNRQRRAIHVAHSGLRWVYYAEPPVEEQRMSAPYEVACPLPSPAAELAPRYQKVLTHLLAGGSEKALADLLGLSRHTIHEYVRAIYRKFNVNSRSELMAHWVEA